MSAASRSAILFFLKCLSEHMRSHFKSLAVRLKTLTLIWLFAAVLSIILTLLLSWRLEGGAAAINDVGSLRMQTYRLGWLVQNPEWSAKAREKLALFDQTLVTLRQGDPSRPLFLPDSEEIDRRMWLLQDEWYRLVRPMFMDALSSGQAVDRARIEHFIETINTLAHTIEEINTRYIKWLRIFQTGLLVMVLVSSMVTVLLLLFWVIRPLKALQGGAEAVHDGHFGTQVQIEDSTEFAQVGTSFNQMSNRLQQLYGHLEQEVADKTRDLTEKNHTLATLYEVSRFLNQTHTAAEAATGFLQKVMAIIPAQAGSIRLIDPQRKRLDLITHIGLPESLQTAEACQRFDECFCGQAVQQSEWQPIRFTEQKSLPPDIDAVCRKSGFHYLRVFSIAYKETDLGMMTLYFSEANHADPMNDLLEALCAQLGSTLSNIRLAGESRQLAVLQERNLMAQGLHDSIAQTLTFLNLQVQMLQSALKSGEQAQVEENLQFIREGVQECYDDVRELLLNFRTKISRKEFSEAVQTLVQRFEQQTHVAADVRWQGDGPPLSAEQQLQFIFILQESLSNVRKHAQSQYVEIEFDNRQDFVMTIRDNGRGFDTGRLNALSGSHVGLNIMRERAKRIHACLNIESEPERYTQVSLTLPKEERILE